jgi:hypothetical protein
LRAAPQAEPSPNAGTKVRPLVGLSTTSANILLGERCE